MPNKIFQKIVFQKKNMFATFTKNAFLHENRYNSIKKCLYLFAVLNIAMKGTNCHPS
jgi:hypothetical protein